MDPRRQPSPRRSRQRFDDPLDRRLDQWLETGRQLVDGVAGARPGSRTTSSRGGRSTGASLDAVGRWVGDKIDWLLDEEEGDWGSSFDDRRSRAVRSRDMTRSEGDWQERRAPARMAAPKAKRPLDAISRRQPPLISPAQTASPAGQNAGLGEADAWPDDDSFRVERWQRSPGTSAPGEQTSVASAAPAGRRPLPRSSRRRA